MPKPALLTCLLAVLSACSTTVIGDAFDAGSDDAGGMTGADEQSARYARDIAGKWLAMFVTFSDIPVTIHLTVSPSDDQPRSGTFSWEVACQPGCPGEADAGSSAPLTFDVQYWFLKPQPGGAVVILSGEVFDLIGPAFALSPQCGYYLKPERIECGPAVFTRMAPAR